MSTLTAEQEQRIAQFLDGRYIPSGLGTKEEACSIAAINLALRGELTDEIPPCMSPVIGQWIIAVQDRMPDTMRNSEAWRKLLPLAAGSAAPEKERARVEIVFAWMWETVLPSLQWIADAHGFGQEWRVMCEERSQTAADAAADGAADAPRVVARDVARVARVAGEAPRVAARVAVVARVARLAGEVEGAVARLAGKATLREAEAVHAAWEGFAPVALLEQLIAV